MTFSSWSDAKLLRTLSTKSKHLKLRHDLYQIESIYMLVQTLLKPHSGGTMKKNNSHYHVLFLPVATFTFAISLMGCSPFSATNSLGTTSASSLGAAPAVTALGTATQNSHFRPVAYLGTTASDSARTGPCEPFRSACEAAGFSLDGAAGDRLISDCIIPLLENKTAISKTSHQTASVSADIDRVACSPHVHKGGTPTTGTKFTTIPTYSPNIAAVPSAK